MVGAGPGHVHAHHYSKGWQEPRQKGQHAVRSRIHLRPGHAGEILSRPGATTQGTPFVVKEGQNPPGFTVQSQAGYIPEIGQSLATALKDNCDRLAVQIVSMMEKPW